MNITKITGLCVFSIQMFAGCLGMNGLAQEDNSQPDLRTVVNLRYYPGRAAIVNDISFFHALFPVEKMLDTTHIIAGINDDDYIYPLWECNAYRNLSGGRSVFLTVYLKLSTFDEEMRENLCNTPIDMQAASELPVVKVSYGTHSAYTTLPINENELYDDLRGDLDFSIPWFILRKLCGQGFNSDHF